MGAGAERQRGHLDGGLLTLIGVLIAHKGHALVSQTNYEIPSGRVFGTPHVILYCRTCREVTWDEALQGEWAGRLKQMEGRT